MFLRPCAHGGVRGVDARSLSEANSLNRLQSTYTFLKYAEIYTADETNITQPGNMGGVVLWMGGEKRQHSSR